MMTSTGPSRSSGRRVAAGLRHAPSETLAAAPANSRNASRRFTSRANRDRGSAFQFAPGYKRAFHRAQNRFPDDVAEHRPVNETHRKNAKRMQHGLAFENAGERGENYIHREKDDDERQDGGPGRKR